MSYNHADNMATGLGVAHDLASRPQWKPVGAAYPLHGLTQYHFAPLENVVVATADGNSLVIGLQLCDRNNKVYNPRAAAGRPELQTMKCKVFPLANESAVTYPEIPVKLGNNLGILTVPLGQEVGTYCITVAGREIKANVVGAGEIITEHAVMRT